MRSSNSNHRDTATRATEGQNGWCRRYVIRSKTKSKSRRTHESPSKPTALHSLGFHDTQHGNARDSTKDKTQRQQHTRRFNTCCTKAQSCSLERQLRADDQERRVERRRWDTTLLNAMIWDPWKPTPVTRGRPLKVRSDREPILMGPIPRLQVNPPDDADTVATPNLETTSGTTTQSVAERTRVRLPESEAEGAPPVQKTRTTPTVPVTTTAETMATTTPAARALVERV